MAATMEKTVLVKSKAAAGSTSRRKSWPGIASDNPIIVKTAGPESTAKRCGMRRTGRCKESASQETRGEQKHFHTEEPLFFPVPLCSHTSAENSRIF
jgi:hypothetical protein